MVVFFCSRETYIEREQGESANDRNDRAIRISTKWYSDHLNNTPTDKRLKVVLLTNDRGNKEKAEESGLLTYRCKKQDTSVTSVPQD
jgi:exosome complex exonuclease DIS3/RRP44